MLEVTILIPTRNRWDLLRRTLFSALAQEDVDFEVIVVADACTDETPHGLAAVDDPRVRVLHNEDRLGVARTRNRGLAQARGAWVAFLDDDDLWAPYKLRAQLDAAARVGASFAYGAAVIVDECKAVKRVVHPPAPDAVARDILVRNVIPGGASNLIARTDVVRRAGGFDEHFSMLADWDLWTRIAQAGEGAACPEIVVAYHRHGCTMLTQGEVDLLDELDRLNAKYQPLREEFGVRLDRRSLHRYFARGHRRGGQRRHAARMYLRAARRDRSPGDLARAAGVVLGERALKTAGHVLGRRPASVQHEPPGTPSWLPLYA